MEIQNVFQIKLKYIINMVKMNGMFKIPYSWWEYANPMNNEPDKNGMHPVSTNFKIIRLDDEFDSQYFQSLSAEGIIWQKQKDGILYKKIIY